MKIQRNTLEKFKHNVLFSALRFLGVFFLSKEQTKHKCVWQVWHSDNISNISFSTIKSFRWRFRYFTSLSCTVNFYTFLCARWTMAFVWSPLCRCCFCHCRRCRRRCLNQTELNVHYKSVKSQMKTNETADKEKRTKKRREHSIKLVVSKQWTKREKELKCEKKLKLCVCWCALTRTPAK